MCNIGNLYILDFSIYFFFTAQREVFQEHVYYDACKLCYVSVTSMLIKSLPKETN